MISTFEQWARGAIGKPEREVVDAIREAGGCPKVISRDGKPAIPSMYTPPDAARANITIENGVVAEITFG